MPITCSKPKRFMRWRLSDEEYSRVLLPKIINRWGDVQLKSLYQIVVLGKKQSDIAREMNVSRSAISNMVRRAYTIYSESVISTLIINR